MLMYRKFLADAARDIDPSMVENCLFLFNEEDDWCEFDEEGKEGVYKENYYLRDNLQTPIIAPVLSKSANRDAIVDFVIQFMDEHSKQLSTSGPVYSFTFGTKETGFLYELFNTNKDKMLELYDNLIKETYYVCVRNTFLLVIIRIDIAGTDGHWRYGCPIFLFV